MAQKPRPEVGATLVKDLWRAAKSKLQRLCGLAVRSFSVVHERALITVTSCLCLRGETSPRLSAVDFHLFLPAFLNLLVFLFFSFFIRFGASEKQDRVSILFNRTLNINGSLIICITRYSWTIFFPKFL